MRLNMFIIPILLLLVGCQPDVIEKEPIATEPVSTVCYNEHCFEVKLAKTKTEHALGLSFQTHLDQDQGMLFVFNEPGLYQFWMKNTYIALDIIWIDHACQVVYIEKNAMPCGKDYCPTIDPARIAKYVLEVNSGAVEQIGLEVGCFVDMNIIEPSEEIN